MSGFIGLVLVLALVVILGGFLCGYCALVRFVCSQGQRAVQEDPHG